MLWPCPCSMQPNTILVQIQPYLPFSVNNLHQSFGFLGFHVRPDDDTSLPRIMCRNLLSNHCTDIVQIQMAWMPGTLEFFADKLFSLQHKHNKPPSSQQKQLQISLPPPPKPLEYENNEPARVRTLGKGELHQMPGAIGQGTTPSPHHI